MIATEIGAGDGLGNQLFRYITLRCMALDHGWTGESWEVKPWPIICIAAVACILWIWTMEKKFLRNR